MGKAYDWKPFLFYTPFLLYKGFHYNPNEFGDSPQ